ncbi:hypothetical protein [Rhodoferax sp. PAMC 29310]|uniref:hypothetical protein n=1 Tax=Rhodoferax sp. PAMC 29310 TaxID=2822760 RepID=UPI001F0B6123|nr:hypothetical protein [Rhodoferax sp. PAMC 29310]
MNRCLPRSRQSFLPALALSFLGALSLLPALSQAQTALQPGEREFPAKAQRGSLQVITPPNVLLNGQAARLSPGARIKGTTNTLVMSGSLVGSTVLVNYVRDVQGLIHEVWILTEQEARAERKGMESVTNFTFGFEADKPKTDDGKTPFNQLPSFSKP